MRQYKYLSKVINLIRSIIIIKNKIDYIINIMELNILNGIEFNIIFFFFMKKISFIIDSIYLNKSKRGKKI
jgi:hypothetical protein